MIKDIYIRDPEDPNFNYGILEHSDSYESIIAKIKVLLGTTPGKVFNNPGFGIGIEDLIFESKINKNALEEKIKSQFDQYISESTDYKITPEVSFGKADGYDYAVIDIYINQEKVIGLLIK